MPEYVNLNDLEENMRVVINRMYIETEQERQLVYSVYSKFLELAHCMASTDMVPKKLYDALQKSIELTLAPEIPADSEIAEAIFTDVSKQAEICYKPYDGKSMISMYLDDWKDLVNKYTSGYAPSTKEVLEDWNEQRRTRTASAIYKLAEKLKDNLPMIKPEVFDKIVENVLEELDADE